MSLITIIGRGHGGTRAISHTLMVSNVFMGEPINRSGDLLPPQPMYDACRVLAQYVQWQGGLAWDFSAPHHGHPRRIHRADPYLSQDGARKQGRGAGWKIPETTLVMPWIVRMFPAIKYIYWVRSPRNILARHVTDDLRRFRRSVPRRHRICAGALRAPGGGRRRRRAQAGRAVPAAQRAISWQYQYEIVKATPKPQNWIVVRFEDFVRQQDATLQRLEAYLGFPLARIIVRPEAVGRYDGAEGASYFDFLDEGMAAFDYPIPH